MQQVEQVVGDLLVAFAIEGVLQRLKVGHAIVVGHHHLAVEPGRVEFEFFQRRNLAWHFCRPVMAVAGEQAHVAVIDAGEDAVAVELDFVAPVAGRRRVHQGGQLRLELFGQGAAGDGFFAGGGFFRRMRRGQAAFAEHAVGLGFEDVVVLRFAGLAIGRFDQQPLLLLARQMGAKQAPAAAELFALQFETQAPAFVVFPGVAFGQPQAPVPDDHVTGAVVPLGNVAFETGVVQRVILDVHGQAFHAGIEGWPLGNRPAFQGAIEFQAKVVVQVAGVVFLDAELQGPRRRATRLLAAGLGAGGEVTFALVLLQGLG